MADKNQDNRPEDSPLKQQRLPAWQPILTPNWVISCFFILTVVFIPIGAAILLASKSVVEVRERYDSKVGCEVQYNSPKVCSFSLTVPSDMVKPVYVYYELTNFYQNHRRYVKSRSDSQLRADSSFDANSDPATDCSPANAGLNGKPLYPCGLIANSMFNDTIAAKVGNSSLAWKKEGIAWPSDKQYKFKAFTDPVAKGMTTVNKENRTMPNVEDEDFIVWMRTAGLPTFKKLYRIIDSQDLKSGTVLNISVVNNFPVSAFEGQKWIVLSTTSWIGGKNEFLGYAYIAVGILTFVLAVFFFIKQKISPRELGDMQYFEAKNAPAR